MKWVSEDFEVFCILNKEDIKNLWNFEKIWVVAQTTLKKETFDELSKELKIKYKNIKISNTICLATTERQDAVRELSEICDFILVIWWINSSNSKKLQEIALKKCHAEKIETFKEVKKEWFLWKKNIWITAWASTPEWLIDEIENNILKMFN
jgi:4-hydroxy-3-methylbut-2-enyl diphosphate reductase